MEAFSFSGREEQPNKMTAIPINVCLLIKYRLCINSIASRVKQRSILKQLKELKAKQIC